MSTSCFCPTSAISDTCGFKRCSRSYFHYKKKCYIVVQFQFDDAIAIARVPSRPFYLFLFMQFLVEACRCLFLTHTQCMIRLCIRAIPVVTFLVGASYQ